jgi:hypothetical protein
LCINNSLDLRAHFLSSIADSTHVIENDDANFVCEVSDEDTNVEWYKNGNLIESSDRYKISKNGRLRTLSITSVKCSDSGEYSCMTSDGRCRTDGVLKVSGICLFFSIEMTTLIIVQSNTDKSILFSLPNSML